MSLEAARYLLAERTQFDYIASREMHLELGGDELHTWAYDKATKPMGLVLPGRLWRKQG